MVPSQFQSPVGDRRGGAADRQLIEEEKFGEAYTLAVKAERYIPHDAMLAKFWPAISWSGSIKTTPPGVSVFRRNYNAPDDAWELIGRSPIKERRFPQTDSEWRLELKGYATVERATFSRLTRPSP